MGKSDPWKLLYYVVMAFIVLVVVPVALYAVYEIYLRLFEQYPNSKGLVIALFVAFFVSAYLVYRVYYLRCARKNDKNKCHSKALNIGIFYSVFVCIAYIVISDWEKL